MILGESGSIFFDTWLSVDMEVVFIDAVVHPVEMHADGTQYFFVALFVVSKKQI